MPELATLCGLAALIGLLHTVFGPDHYVPFIAMARAGRWSLRKTTLVTLVCGIGHVGSSVLLGIVGAAGGWALGGLEEIESSRGHFAAWLLLAFGLAYLAWGVHRAIRNKTHGHVHLSGSKGDHYHAHEHDGDHSHSSDAESRQRSMTPWILFTIFVFGPCEPLIPFLIYPALEHSAMGVAVVAGVFAVCTIATMLAVVLVGLAGLRVLRMGWLERYSHALAGLVIVVAALAIHFGLEGPPPTLDPIGPAQQSAPEPVPDR